MIEYHYETDFKLREETKFTDWITRIFESEQRVCERLDYIFCNDEYLLEINRKYLNHDTFTDIVTFDYSEGGNVIGDIFISVERVKENGLDLNINFEDELLRVMSHGVLHLLGYNDKKAADVDLMREKENEKIKLFHVEQ
ncbi:rRNA maturation RNase YbeY [Spongiimicrobium sp. 3-5]|uniref:rRNA maturation RNase YbeY n=1 Tax=Spongiimicrobium sp. 3-5 TaxID=3332596 RepID=UPI003980C9BC